MSKRMCFIVSFCLMSVMLLTGADKQSSVLKYGDDKADGMKSFGSNGEMIKFTLPAETGNIKGVLIHGSRYGYPKAPKEDFLIYILNENMSEVLHTQMAPYGLFERGENKWVEVKFNKPLEVPKEFWVVLDFRAHKTKGIYVSFDTSTQGVYSKMGLPGLKAEDVDFGGDWMIQVLLSDAPSSEGITIPGVTAKGAILTKRQGKYFYYKKKCGSCGYVNPKQRGTELRPVFKMNFKFDCPKCKKTTKGSIQRK
jgi:hypothetical protein